jgi:F-type H+-transporting ATPase subunit b
MNIDLAQIITHAVGFLIAVWLVKRYAWERMLRFIEHRRETIAKSFSDIDKGRMEVEAEKQRYAAQIENIEATRRARIQEAAREAEKLSGDIREEARRETVAMRQKAKQDIALEIDKANIVLRNRMIDAVFVTTEKILRERLDREKHARLIDDFLTQVQENETWDESRGGAA